MPVAGLMPGLMEVGKIKIGIKGAQITSKKGNEFRPPKKLDHIQIVKNERDQDGDFIIDRHLMDRLIKSNSDQVVLNDQGQLVGIPIRLLYNDIDLNFPTRYARYSRGKCACEGNGIKGNTRDGREIDCPCQEFELGNCKVNGTLSCIIDGNEILGGCHKFRTTSINTVSSILGSLSLIKTITKGHLAFLPLTLMLQPKITTTPSGDSTKVYIMSIVFKGNIDTLRQAAISNVKENTQYLLDMQRIEDDARGTVDIISPEDDIEIMEEFYPDAAKHIEQVKTVPTDQPIVEPPEDPKPVERDLVREQNVCYSMLKNLKKDQLVSAITTLFPDLSIVDAKTKNDLLAILVDNFNQIADPIQTVQQLVDGLSREPEPVESTNSEPKPTGEKPEPPKDDSATCTQDELREIVVLKRQNNINDPEKWMECLKPFGVATARDLTMDQAKELISKLKAMADEDIPF